MPTSFELQGTRKTFEPRIARPDEATWRAWVEKMNARERRNLARWMKIVKLTSSTVLVTTAALWPDLAEFHLVIRFVVSVGAVVAMYQAFQAKNYAVGALFGALALLFNPIVPVFSFVGEWQRAVIAVSSIPFIGSLVWRNAHAA